ncbi:MAG: hypothetical protein ACW97P_12950, partial [Candidatus Hodarchaeales archaeon]
MENCKKFNRWRFLEGVNTNWEKWILFPSILLLMTMCMFAQSSGQNALKIDGVDDYAYPLTPNAAGLSEGTVELWFLT